MNWDIERQYSEVDYNCGYEVLNLNRSFRKAKKRLKVSIEVAIHLEYNAENLKIPISRGIMSFCLRRPQNLVSETV